MYYLIEHNRTTKETDWTEYSDYSVAQATCLQKEQQHFVNHRKEMEVVVFEAESLDALKQTHSRYFAKSTVANDVAGVLVAAGLVSLAIYLLRKK